jgi:preprotein translocase subunit SecD
MFDGKNLGHGDEEAAVRGCRAEIDRACYRICVERIAQLGLATLAGVCALWLALARYPIGLDFKGGAVFAFRPTTPVAELDPLVDRLAHLLGLTRAEVTASGHGITVELEDASLAEVEALVSRVTHRKELALHELATSGRTVRAGDGTAYTIAEPAAITARDIAAIEPQDGTVLVTFTAAGARKLAELSRRSAGKLVAITLGDEVVSAPMMREPITGSSIVIDRVDPALAARLTAATLPPLEVERVSVIESGFPRWAGRPLAIVVAAFAALLWLLVFATRRRDLAIAGAALVAWSLSVTYLLWIRGTLTLACYATGALAAITIGLATAIAARDRIPARWLAAWPAAIVLVVLAVVSVLARGSQFIPASFPALPLWHGLRAFQGVVPVIAVLGLLALAARPSR